MANIISTRNEEEVKKFGKLSAEFWDPNSSLKPLQSYNSLRVPLIESTIDINQEGKKRILDIGCGGGLLSEALGKRFHSLGLSEEEIEIIGLEPAKENVEVARSHLPKELQGKVTYICDTIENYVVSHPTPLFDTVVMSEVIEHVDNPKEFLKYAVSVAKPGGSIILTTPGKTFFSWLIMIVLGEYILRMVPIGTHYYEKFVALEDSLQMLKENNCTVVEERGSFYNPLTNTWRWNRFTKSCWYSIHAVKNV